MTDMGSVPLKFKDWVVVCPSTGECLIPVSRGKVLSDKDSAVTHFIRKGYIATGTVFLSEDNGARALLKVDGRRAVPIKESDITHTIDWDSISKLVQMQGGEHDEED